MAQEVTLDGKVYVSSKRAAEIGTYTQDYIGQLARASKIDARRVAGLWYVSMDSIEEHKQNSELYAPHPPKRSGAKEADETFVGLDGNTYVSASRAAKSTSYNQDYITQLARSARVPSQQVGARWFVDLEALQAYKEEKDALLAEVQVEAVGIVRKNESAVESKESTLEQDPVHFTYKAETIAPDAFFVEKQEVASTGDKESEKEIEENTIPIRVVRQAPMRMPKAARANSFKLPGMTSKIIAILVVGVVGIGIFSLNFGAMLGSSNDKSSVSESKTAVAKSLSDARLAPVMPLVSMITSLATKKIVYIRK